MKRIRVEHQARPVNWACISAKEQSHMQCRYCHTRAEWMRKEGKHYVPLCPAHAGQPETEKK